MPSPGTIIVGLLLLAVAVRGPIRWRGAARRRRVLLRRRGCSGDCSSCCGPRQQAIPLICKGAFRALDQPVQRPNGFSPDSKNDGCGPLPRPPFLVASIQTAFRSEDMKIVYPALAFLSRRRRVGVVLPVLPTTPSCWRRGLLRPWVGAVPPLVSGHQALPKAPGQLCKEQQ